MAVTDLGEQLTELHRRRQILLRAETARAVAQILRLFDLTDIGASWANLEPNLVALVQGRQPASSALAADYFTAFRSAERVPGTARPVIAPVPTVDEIIPNLRIVGPAQARRLVDLKRLDAFRVVASNVEGEVARQLLGGGRSTLERSINADRRCIGYIRVTDGNPCAFCAMLAGRGPVYKTKGSAEVRLDGRKYHTRCGCTSEPLYSDTQPWPRSARRWESLYQDVKSSGGTSADIRREFRRRYDALTA